MIVCVVCIIVLSLFPGHTTYCLLFKSPPAHTHDSHNAFNETMLSTPTKPMWTLAIIIFIISIVIIISIVVQRWRRGFEVFIEHIAMVNVIRFKGKTK